MATLKKVNGEEEEILKELCLANGLTYSRLGQEGLSCVRLEMFFCGFPRMVGLNSFPNLQVLCIIGQSINRIEGLQYVPKLKELWIAECNFTRMVSLNHLKQLRRLYLYTNNIQKMENLDHMTDLETLWLTDNKISVIEGLTGLKQLRELNLAENRIEKIGNSLNGLQNLEKLELSGNKVSSFRDLTNLTRLPNLRDLGLKSPEFSPSPVGLLCNYAPHILFHLPQLQHLDTYDVSGKAVKDLAETTVLKKKMYYNMKVKTISRNLSELVRKLGHCREEVCQGPKDRLKALFFAIKEIDREIRELKELDEEEGRESGTESDKDAREAKAIEDKSTIEFYKHKQRSLKERVKRWEKKCVEIEQYHLETKERLQAMTDLSVQRLMVELETGGNVRFEDGRPSDIWFTSCQDLILSRFCTADYKEQGIVGIKIHRITRIHNRILRSRFDEALSNLVEEEDSYLPMAKPSTYKKLLEYLFWVWDPELPGGQHEPSRVIEEGFMDASTYRLLGKEGGIPLTNSLSIADNTRIQHLVKVRGKESTDPCPYRYGQLVICKVYIGKSSQAADNRSLDRNHYPKFDSVFRPRKDPDKNGRSSTEGNGVTVACECSGRQSEWFIFNHEFVLPEYAIDFEYVTKAKSKSPFATFGEKEGSTNSISFLEELPTDDDVLVMPPEITRRPRLIALSEELLLKTAKVNNLLSIRVLNLHGNSLNKLKYLQTMPNLRKLIVSFNDLSRLDDVAHMPLEYIDASFNKISTLDGLKGMSRLKHLDLSWNRLYSTRDDISILRKHCPSLATLDLRHNDWQKPQGLRLRAIGRIKSLTKLNGAPVTESEATAALRMAAGSRISQVSLLAHSRTDTVRLRTLNLASCAQVLCLMSRNKPDRVGDQDNLWFSKVTTLNLDSQHISKLSNLERLENLRWASFNDNDITKIEGLDTCMNLEELSLEDNCITKLEGLSKNIKLRRLSMGHNYLSSLENAGLERLSHLCYISLESNRITTMAGLQRINSLMELYIGNNLLENVREVFFLKNLPNLVILDLSGNPISNAADNYRLFVIYHLKSLKALDGQAIEASEGSQAKDTFGGRLTQDFVAERIGNANFPDVKELDFPSCGIRNVDLGNGDLFLSLRSVNLEHNNMTSFSGLIYLINLRVLCLNHNHVECIVPRPKQQPPQMKRLGTGPANQNYSNIFAPDTYTPILENLEVLHLGYNGIKDLGGLQLGRLTSLKALFLQGNEISKVEGLEGLQDLRELVLDRNKIKVITEYSFINQWNLQELHMEENRVKELSNLSCLERLQRLFLGMNRIQDISELEKLESLGGLVELSVVGNAVARRMLHRPMLVYRMPSLVVIDGIPVSDEERTKADLYFMEQNVLLNFIQNKPPKPVPMPPQLATMETTLPGIGQYKTQIPVKVTNMQLMSGPYFDKTWGGTIHLSEDNLQQDIQKVGGNTRKRGSGQNNGGSMVPPSSSKAGGTLSYQHAGNSGNLGNYGNGNRSQHQISSVPYVPHQEGATDYASHSESLTRLTKNQRR